MRRRDWDQEQVRTNPQVRLAYQIWDLMRIKHLAAEHFLLEPDKDKLIYSLMEDWVWLFDNGWSLEAEPRKWMTEEEQKRFDQSVDRFSQLQQWILENQVLITY